jgi:hypothetical protein
MAWGYGRRRGSADEIVGLDLISPPDPRSPFIADNAASQRLNGPPITRSYSWNSGSDALTGPGPFRNLLPVVEQVVERSARQRAKWP